MSKELFCPYCEAESVRANSEPLFFAAIASSPRCLPLEPVEGALGYVRPRGVEALSHLQEGVVEQMAFLKRAHPEAFHSQASCTPEVVEAIARSLRRRYVNAKPYGLPCDRAVTQCGRVACAKYPGFVQFSERPTSLVRAMGPLLDDGSDDLGEAGGGGGGDDGAAAADECLRGLTTGPLPAGPETFALHASLVDIQEEGLQWEFEDHGENGNGWGAEGDGCGGEGFGAHWGQYVKEEDVDYMLRVCVEYPEADKRGRRRGGGHADPKAPRRRFVKGMVELRRGCSAAEACDIVTSSGLLRRTRTPADAASTLDSATVHVWPLMALKPGAREKVRAALLAEGGQQLPSDGASALALPGAPPQKDAWAVLEKGKFRESKVTAAVADGVAGAEDSELTAVFTDADDLLQHMVDEHFSTRPRPYGSDLLARDYRGVGKVPRLTFGKEGNGPEQLKAPCAVAFTCALPGAQGSPEVLVVDGGNHRVVVLKLLARKAEAVRRIGKQPSGGGGKKGGKGAGGGAAAAARMAPGIFNMPAGIAFDGHASGGGAGAGTGRIAVADALNHRVQVFDKSGKLAFAVGERGSDPGQLRTPKGVAFGPDGHLAVVEEGNHRVSLYMMNGGNSATFVRTFGKRGKGAGELNFPVAVATRMPASEDEEHEWAVVDQSNHRINFYGPDGMFLRSVGGPVKSKAPGQFNSPSAVAFGPEGDMMVADTKNNRVQLFWAAAAGSSFAWEFGDAEHFPAPVGVAWGGAEAASMLGGGDDDESSEEDGEEDADTEDEDDGDKDMDDDEDDSDDSDAPLALADMTPEQRERVQIALRRQRAEADAAASGALLVVDARMHKVKAFVPPKKVYAGTLARLPRAFAFAIVGEGWLSYADARAAAPTNRWMLAACRAARLSWCLPPLSPGLPARWGMVLGQRRRVRGTGLFLVDEAWKKWGGAGWRGVSIMGENGFTVQRGVMRYSAGFRSAVADVAGTRFWHANERRLRLLFAAAAKRRARARLVAGLVEEELAHVRDLHGEEVGPSGLIGRQDFQQIMTFVQEVALDITEWEAHAAIRPPTRGGSGPIRPPTIDGTGAGQSEFDEREDMIREVGPPAHVPAQLPFVRADRATDLPPLHLQHLSHLLPKVQGLFKKERLDLMVADMTPQEKQALLIKQQAAQKQITAGHSHCDAHAGPES